MHFYLPRRHRRQLLFPPGLLTLAGLLWLGCVALGPWQEKLSRKVVIQLTMPSLKVADTIFSPNPTFWSSTRLNNFRAWRTIKIDGHPEIDVTTTGNRIGQALMTMQADTLHESGLRIRFGPHATYTHLILVINAMDQYNQKKYWLDITHGPPAFYAITTFPTGEKQDLLPPCGTTYYNLAESSGPRYRSPSCLVRFDDWVTELWNSKPAYEAKYYPYGPPYAAPVFAPERKYLSALSHQWADILVPFHQLA